MGKKTQVVREAFDEVQDPNPMPTPEAAVATGINVRSSGSPPGSHFAFQLPPSNDEDPLMSMSEVATYVGKSPQTIARWVQDGLLTTVRVGPLLKIRRSALAQFLGGSALQARGA